MSFSEWVFTRPFTLLAIVLLSVYSGMILLGIFATIPRKTRSKTDPETVKLLRAQRAARVEANHEDTTLFI